MSHHSKQRRKSRKLKYVLTGIAILIALLSLWTFWQNTHCVVTEYTVYSEELPEAFDGFRVLQISDFHTACFGEDNEQLIIQARRTNPDIIVITGDFADSRNHDFSVCFSFAKRLCEIAPVYYTTGNHEHFFSKNEQSLLYSGLEEAGVTLLMNESTVLERGGESITLIGLKDLGSFKHHNPDLVREKLEELMPGSGFTLLLSHRPLLLEVYASCGADAVLTGHAHGGQVRLPFIGGLYAPEEAFFPEYTSGLHRMGDTQMIISRGIGNSTFPIRFNNPPEMVLVELKTAE